MRLEQSSNIIKNLILKNMKEILSSSEHINHEYCCTVVRIGDVKPIEGSDFLGQTLVNGLSIVVRKDLVKEGDIMFYAANETMLNKEFLSVTNQFEMGHRELNKNYKDIERRLNLIDQLRSEDKFEEAADLELETKQMVGYFNQHGRVKMITIRKCPSMGYLFSVDSMAEFCPEIKQVNLEEWIDKDFDTVNGVLFVKVYIPQTKERSSSSEKRAKKRMKKLAKFDRMIPGQFAFHYDTQQLNRTMYRINPDDVVTISTKVHGTSAIIGNILVKKPKYDESTFLGKMYNKVFVYLPKWLQYTVEDYDVICSSRSVIINSSINPNKGEGFAGGQVQKNIASYAKLLGPYIPKGVTVYAEIIGYYEGTSTPIQTVGNGYDYGCASGTNVFMPYRISQATSEGTKEWNVADVAEWTKTLMNDHPELGERLMPIDILYHGKLMDLYPDINVADHWRENVLERLKNDKEHFHMEETEPLCTNKVYREGIVLRIDNDPMVEAFKLKCLKFLDKYGETIDKGQYQDAEVDERYGSDDDEN